MASLSPLLAGILERMKKMAMRIMRCCPKIRDKIDSELKKLNEEFERETINRTKGVPYVTSLPAQGIDRDEIIKLVERSVYLGKDMYQVLSPSLMNIHYLPIECRYTCLI